MYVTIIKKKKGKQLTTQRTSLENTITQKKKNQEIKKEEKVRLNIVFVFPCS